MKLNFIDYTILTSRNNIILELEKTGQIIKRKLNLVLLRIDMLGLYYGRYKTNGQLTLRFHSYSMPYVIIVTPSPPQSISMAATITFNNNTQAAPKMNSK